MTALRTDHGSPTWSSSPCVGVEEVLVRAQREDQPGRVGDQQHDRDGERHLLERRAGKCSAVVGRARQRRRRSRARRCAGMISATTASSSISDCALAAVRSKYWRSRLRPPTNIAAPMTSRMLPRIEPTSEALTTSCSPSLSAKKAMISSGALPNVTLRKPPMPGPERAASSSVARPISAAVGITPSAEVTKISVALRVRELEHDRDRDERDEQVRPARRRSAGSAAG